MTRMKLFAATTAALLLATAVPAQAQSDLKIGFVNTQVLLQQSPQTQALNDQMQREFAPRDADLRAKAEQLQEKAAVLERDEAVMTQQEVAEQARALETEDLQLQREARALQEDLDMRREELLQGLQQSLGNRIRAFAEDNDYDMIFSNAVYVSEAVDVTEEVLEFLAAGSAGGNE